MTGEIIPDSIMELYNVGEKVDKQNYKEILAETMSDLSNCEKESDRLLLLAAKYMTENADIQKLVGKYPNDMELGKKLRSLYWEKEKEKKNVEKDL